MPINLTLTADSAEELRDLVFGLANEMGEEVNIPPCIVEIIKEAKAHAKKAQEEYGKAPDMGDLPDVPMTETPTQTEAESNLPVDPAFDSDDDDYEDEDEDEDEDELTGCNDTPDTNIATHFDEIFGTVGQRPMCGDKVTINGSIFQGTGTVINTNYSLLYDAAYDYDTKIIRVRAANGKKYNYNKADLRAKKVTKA